MKRKTSLMLACFRAPKVVAWLRIIATFVVLIWNPFSLRFRYFQLIPFLVLVVNFILYCKLFSDAVPVITLFLPTIMHFAMLAVMYNTMNFVPFIPLFTLDVLYVVAKTVKASFFPFEVEGEDEENLDDIYENEAVST